MCNMLMAVSNRHLCRDDYFQRMSLIAAARPFGILLREKDLTAEQYRQYAQKLSRDCFSFQTRLFINNNLDIAQELNLRNIWLSFNAFSKLVAVGCRYEFECLVVSVHSVSEAVFACQHGADMVVAGHIFATDCKKGVPPRGLNFLKKVVAAVPIPVLGIGGINTDNAARIIETGAQGVCVMSDLMMCEAPLLWTKEYIQIINPGS